MSSISKLWQKLRNKAYRDGYTEGQLSIEVPFQIRALRKARGWTQTQLAERCGIPQARISHIEQPGRDPLSLRTLHRLASAFDVGLLVQFVSFSELVHREAAFNPETYRVTSFEDDHLVATVHIATQSFEDAFRINSLDETLAALEQNWTIIPSTEAHYGIAERFSTHSFILWGEFPTTSTTLFGEEALWSQDEPHRTSLQQAWEISPNVRERGMLQHIQMTSK